jgi:MFS family permease
VADPSTRATWILALGLSLSPALSNGLARFAYGLILPAMREDLAWTYTEAGWINTANALGYLIGAVLALRFVGAVGPKRLFIAGMALTTLSLAASGLTRDLWLQSLWRVTAGIGGAPAFIAGGAIAATLFKGDIGRNALAIAIYFGGGGIGMVVTGFSIPFIIERYGVGMWPSTWLLMSALGACATIPATWAALSVPPSVQTNGRVSDEPLPVARMSAALTGYFLFAVGYIVYLTFLVAWMRAQGASALLVASTWSLLGAAVILSPFPWKSILAKSTGGGALALACAASGVGTLLPLVVPGASGFMLSAIVFGTSFFIAPTSVTSFGRKNLPEANWGRLVALFTTAFAAGQTLGPVVAGYIADATHSLSLGLVAAAGTLLVAGVIAAGQRSLGR